MKIKTINLGKKFNDKELFNNFNIETKECGFYALVGESGCGKSTFFKMLLNRDKDYTGNILFNDNDIKNIEESEFNSLLFKNISYIDQNYQSFDFMTVKEFLTLLIEDINIINTERFIQLTKNLMIDNLLDRLCKQLSGGQKQRVAICKALLENKECIFVDEPTSSQDKKNAEIIFSLLEKESKDKLILIISHDIKRASTYCDVIWKLQNQQLTLVKEKNISENLINKNNITLTKRKSSYKEIFFKSGIKSYILSTICLSFLISFCITSASIGTFNYLKKANKINAQNNDFVIATYSENFNDYYNGANVVNTLDNENVAYFRHYNESLFNHEDTILSTSNENIINETLITGTKPTNDGDFIISDLLYYLITNDKKYDLSKINNLIDNYSCTGIYSKSTENNYVYFKNYENKINKSIPLYINSDIELDSYCFISQNTDSAIYGRLPLEDNEIAINYDLIPNYSTEKNDRYLNKEFNILNEASNALVNSPMLGDILNNKLKIVGILNVTDDNNIIVLNDNMYQKSQEFLKKYYFFDDIYCKEITSNNLTYYGIDVLNNQLYSLSQVKMIFYKISWVLILLSFALFGLYLLLRHKTLKQFNEAQKNNNILLLNMGYNYKELEKKQIIFFSISNIIILILNIFLTYLFIFAINNVLIIFDLTSIYIFEINIWMWIIFNLLCISYDIINSLIYFKKGKIYELD